MKNVLRISLVLGLWIGCGGGDPPGRDGSLQRDLFPSMDYHAQSCAPASCSGCCMSNTCMLGKDPSACGASGNPCQICKTGETCQNGICQGGTCSATTCASGCCDLSSTCQNGTSSTTCGAGGATCKKCSDGQSCKNGNCTSTTTGKFKVTLVSAQMPAECGSWDTCDTYVILTVGSTEKKSTTKLDTATPTWNEELLTATEADLTSDFRVKIYDEDDLSDDLIDQCSLNITPTILATGTIAEACGTSVKNLTFTFKPE